MTVEEFLVWEGGQVGRHDFVGGEIFAMSGAEDRHVTVSLNIAMALRLHLAGSACRTYMADMKVQAEDNIFYPDVVVTCSEADRGRPFVKRDPTLIVEVLSPSTAAYDRGEKFARYRQIPTLREFALVDPHTRRTDVYRKGEDGLWVLHPFAAAEGVEFASVGLAVEATALFAEVEESAEPIPRRPTTAD
jgi:Uma2 family endonuclease